MSISYHIDSYSDNQKIWRYIDFTKLISLIESSKLFLARADSMVDDPFEGSYPLLNIIKRKKDGLPDKLLYELEQVNTKFKEYVYFNCWHANDYESAAMWNLYLKSNEGVAIQTKLKHLKNSLKNHNEHMIHIRDIKYIDYSKDEFNDNDVLEAFIHKRKSFEHEKEIRIMRALLNYSKSEDILNDPNKIIIKGGLSIDVDLEMLIQKIYIAPDAPKWFYNLVVDVLKRYDSIYNIDLSSRVKKSNLKIDPIF
ncbi:MAG: DUF2971 domain-containing protein [Vallitalea sp.]|jgi:hypothetical protein|nr:DUF2971 domain-containing protein [Vallitalea sp.]